MGDVLHELEERGFVEQVTDRPGLAALLARERVSAYCGFDPTARSLQVGNMIPLLCLRRLQHHGHRPILVVGGATGMVGDPSGRSAERNLLSPEELEANVAAFRKQLPRFVDFDGPAAAILVNNHDWIAPISHLAWLRDVGKHFSVNYMIAKESVRRRLTEKEQGISYTEFSYMLLQAYDFLHLYRAHGCRLQIGGGDQWGNITAGIELIRRTEGGSAYGLTIPLLLSAAGEKVGKTAGSAVWLDPEMTSPFAFYQYWVRTDDRDAVRFLRLLTEIPDEEIRALGDALATRPEERAAQRRLAEEVTRLVHGAEGLTRARAATEVLYGGPIGRLSDRELLEIFADVPSVSLPRARLAEGIRLVDLACEAGLCPSKGEAKRRIEGGGLYVNNRRESDRDRMLGPADLASESVLVLRLGKRDYRLVRFT